MGCSPYRRAGLLFVSNDYDNRYQLSQWYAPPLFLSRGEGRIVVVRESGMSKVLEKLGS